MISAAWALFKKDLTLEWRAKVRALAVVIFGTVTLVLFSFALGPDVEALRDGASGFLTLALLLTSTLALNESFRIEREDDAIEGLLLIPTEPAAVFYGKALANALLLVSLGPLLIALSVVLYDLTLDVEQWGRMLLVWSLASLGLSAPGTLYVAMTSKLKSQDVALPLLLFPLVVPVLLGSVKAMGFVLEHDPMRQLGSWLSLLTAFTVIYWAVSGLLFPFVVEENA